MVSGTPVSQGCKVGQNKSKAEYDDGEAGPHVHGLLQLGGSLGALGHERLHCLQPGSKGSIQERNASGR